MLHNQVGTMFQLHTTHDVIAEALYRLRRKNPEWNGSVTARLHDIFVENVDEVLGEFDASIDFDGSDANDRHVHAAAVHCKADILLTNDGGFSTLAGNVDLSYSVYSADDFFVLIDDSAALSVRAVVDEQRAYWSRRATAGETPMGLVEALTKSGCPAFAARVHEHLRVLSGPTARGDFNSGVRGSSYEADRPNSVRSA